MTLDELKTLLLTIDPSLTKWTWDGSAGSYTVWSPHHRTTLMTDDEPERVTVKVTIDRWTKDPSDTVHNQILQALEERFVPTDEMLTVFDNETGYFRYIIECYVTDPMPEAEPEEPEEEQDDPEDPPGPAD